MSVKSQSSAGSSKIKRNPPKLSDDGLEDEMDEKGVIKRKSRNLSEKKRRDQFNILINELGSMVGTGKSKMDKSAVLKTAISSIRNHNQMTKQSHSQEVQEDWKPSFLSNEEFTHLMLEAMDEFIIVFSASGKILYISENIICLLEHAPSDLIGSTIFDFVWHEERNEIPSLLRSWADDEMNNSAKENHRSFSCYFRRGNINDTVQRENSYELVFISGYYRMQGNPEASRKTMSSWDDSKESTNCTDALSQHNGLVFVASVRLQTPQILVEMSIVDVFKSEFTSRHSLEWKFLFLDHRGPPIIGYLPFEVLGTSGYDYYHIDDLEKVSESHEALMQKGEVTSCCYRFLTKGQQWIWLKTKYYITYHQWYSKPEFIVCSHRVLSYNEVTGHQLVKLENEDTVQDRNTDEDIPVPIIRSTKSKSEIEELHSTPKKLRKPASHSTDKVRRLSCEEGSCSSHNGRSRSNSSSNNMGSNRTRSHRSQHTPRSTFNASEPGSPTSKTSLHAPRPPYFTPGNESVSSQHSSRQASGSSRVGTGFSDTGSISSVGSFQSAASQHSRYSDQSMHSFHSQQSHHSMQSVQNQPHQSMGAAYQPGSISSMNTAQQHLNEEIVNFPHDPHDSFMNYRQPKNSVLSYDIPKNSDVETYLSSPKSPAENSTGHQFLQPRVNSGTAGRRNLSGNASANSPNPSIDPPSQMFMYQPVLNVDSSNLPVHQRIMEGLPVVTLPGLVAHEPLTMSAAQKEFHEQLRMKHYQLQKQIAAQQNELRRVSEQLLFNQYGPWGSTVFKVAVPHAENNGMSATASHVLSAGGLVPCSLPEETHNSVDQMSQSFGQPTTVTISSETPILVHSSEYQRPNASNDTISTTGDSSQVLMRTAQQQENLVQLSQQDIQMLLAQNLLQDNQLPSTEYLS